MTNPIYTIIRRLRSPLILLIIVYAISILGFVLIPGVDDQGQLWDMGFFHAFYFVSFMGTTIGFGEIPYAFTDAQRFWALVTMYATVISWLYGIGVLLSVFQDKLFLNQLRKNTFSRKIKKIREPFYIICGYGDTGVQLTRLLSEEGILSVVIDTEAERIHDLESDDFNVLPVGLCDDASQSEVLEMAGICNPYCKGIISIVNDDTVNLTVAIVTQLLNPKLRLIARAETPEAEANILSFGANEVINPFEIFASRMSLAMQSPSVYALYDWMTGASGVKMEEPPQLLPGVWIICEFGRFGRALYENLDNENVTLRYIENDRTRRDLPVGSIIGRATEAPSLLKAGIADAVGIIAGTRNDANNLSIILTATELNPDIFRVIRQNKNKNSHLFQSAKYEMLMQRGSIVSNTIFAFIRTPMLGDFLRIVARFNNEKANELVSRIIGVIEDDEVRIWEFKVNFTESPALYNKLKSKPLLVSDILKCDANINHKASCSNQKLSAIPLFMKINNSNVLLPENDRAVQMDDRFLMCGSRSAYLHMKQMQTNENLLEQVLSGKDVPSSSIWRWIKRRRI